MALGARHGGERGHVLTVHQHEARRSQAGTTLLLALLATVGLAACGSSSSSPPRTTANAPVGGTPPADGTPTSSTPPATTTPSSPATGATASPTAVRTCLSKNGITLPQNTPGGGLAGVQMPKGMSREQFARALQSCGAGRLDGANRYGKGGKPSTPALNRPRFHAALARFVGCLRQQGINVGEPNTSGKGPIFDTKKTNTASPKFKTATTKCLSALNAHRIQKNPLDGTL